MCSLAAGGNSPEEEDSAVTENRESNCWVDVLGRVRRDTSQHKGCVLDRRAGPQGPPRCQGRRGGEGDAGNSMHIRF